MQSRNDDPHTDITDFNDQPALPLVDPGEKDGISDISDPVSKPPDNDALQIVPPTLSQPSPTPPLNPRYPPSKTDVLPSNTPLTPSISATWYFVIATSV